MSSFLFDLEYGKAGCTDDRLSENTRLVDEEPIVPVDQAIVEAYDNCWIRESFEIPVPDAKPVPPVRDGTTQSLFDSYDQYGSLNSTTRSLSRDKIIDDQTKYQTSLYASKVRRPSEYRREKKENRWKCTNILRMLAGVPFAVLYGAALYLILRFIFIDNTREQSSGTSSNSSNISNTIIGEKANLALYSPNNYTDVHLLHAPKVEFEWGENRMELIYGSLCFTIVLGTVSIFSRGIRCCMLLMLPCLITGRSRAVLFTFVAGLIVEGPLTGIVHNFNELSKNTACVYDAVTQMTIWSLNRLNQVSQAIGFEPAVKPSILELGLAFPRVNALKEQMAWMKEGVNDMEEIMIIVRKVLTAISLVLMTYDAIFYLRSYYSDNSFDNKYINQNVRRFWKLRKHPDILPLRHWELNDGYKEESKCVVTKREVKAYLQRVLPTLLFSIFAVVVVVADHLLWKVVVSMRDEETISISLDDKEDGLSKIVKHILKTFHEKTKYCGLNPLQTPQNSYVLIGVFLAVAIISCVFEVLIFRLRSRMCNIFYTDRAQERADYLHFRIKSGRVNRKNHLMFTIKSNAEKITRLSEFSPWATLKKKVGCNQTSETIICPGCDWDLKSSDGVAVKCEWVKTEKHLICKDCYHDYRPVSFHHSSEYINETPKEESHFNFNFKDDGTN